MVTSLQRRALQVAALSATAAPSLLAYNQPPSPTFLNQALALALWGAFVALAAPREAARWRGAGALFAALALLAAGVCWAWGPGALPAGLALSALGMLAAAALMVAGGAGQHAAGAARAAQVFLLVCTGLAVAGVLNVGIAVVQVFAPGVPDGEWIARSGLPGRAVGNLRQPNHLSSLLLWSTIAVVALAEAGRLGRRGWAVAAALSASMVFAVVLTASRTGLVSVLLLAVWGLADRRLARPARALLLAAPLLYALAWFGMAEWARASQHTFGGAARLAETDLSSSRFGIWADTLALVRAQPWTGVGFGEFNFAWTLTPFPGRPVAFFDHSHNLPLQLLVELGVPLGTAVLALLAAALWQTARRALAEPDPGAATARRCAGVMVVMIGVHSLLEYPLWYAYFLLPAAWIWAFALGLGPGPGVAAAPAPAPAGRGGALTAGAGLALVLASAAAVADYRSVTLIFTSPEGGGSLAERIARGQRSLLFAHHADYAAATNDTGAPRTLQPFVRATHYLLDTRLMLAWAQALARAGRVEQARFLADRLREFRNPASDEFFASCGTPPPAGAAPAPAPAFQCQPAAQQHHWRDFLAP